MSIHEQITSAMQRFIDERSDCAIIAPQAVASAVLSRYAGGLEAHVEYGALEHFKHMARRVLAGRFESDGDDNPAYDRQGEFFSGHLQARYPTPAKRGEDRCYKRLEDLRDSEIAWNVQALRKAADGRLLHADALAAWLKARAHSPVAA